MITLKTTDFMIRFISFFTAYVVTITIAGFSRAWTAHRFGDDTPEQAGLLTLNPIAHIDPVGVFLLALFSFGWGRYVPINPFNITGNYRYLKLFAAHLADVAAYFIQALVGMVILLLMFDQKILLVIYSVVMDHPALLRLMQLYPSYPTAVVMTGFIMVAYVYLCVVLGALYAIINMFSVAVFFVAERTRNYAIYGNLLVMMLIPIILIIFFSDPLKMLALGSISKVGNTIALLLKR